MSTRMLVPGEPTPRNPEIYYRSVITKSDGEPAFIIPRRWRSRINLFFHHKIEFLEARNFGLFVVFTPLAKKPAKMKMPLRKETPTLERPHIHNQKFLKGYGGWVDDELLTIPIRWKRIVEEVLHGKVRQVEIRDCGLVLVLKPTIPSKKIGILDDWEN